MMSTLKQPSAWIPIVLSLTMLATVLITISIAGTPAPQPEADEGVGAHLFQLWLVAEVVMIAYFGIKWLPQKPIQAFVVLAVQMLAVITACAPVFLLHL